MAHPYHHARSSVKKYGGKVKDYLRIHQWFDQTKGHVADARHRMVLHNSFGIFLMERHFGPLLTNSDGKVIPTRFIGEQHVMEDLGRIPSLQECLSDLPLRPWMAMRAQRLSETLEQPSLERWDAMTISEKVDRLSGPQPFDVGGPPNVISKDMVFDEASKRRES